MNEQQLDRYAYDGLLTNAQAKGILIDHLDNISSSQKYLVQATERYGDRILTR